MHHAVWLFVSLATLYWSCARAKDDVIRQRRIGHTFGEAHVTDRRMTLVLAPLFGSAIVFVYSMQQPSIAVLVAFLACVAVGLRVSLVDIDTHSIPRRIMFVATLVLLVLLTFASLTTRTVSLVSVVIGAVASWIFMRLLELVSRGDIGHADVVLSAFLGLFVGAVGLERLPMAIFGAFVSAGLVAAVLLATKRMTRQSHIPFGPFLVLGMVVAVLR